MKELNDRYLFQSSRHREVILRKGNYNRHIHFHPEIAGKEGLEAIEDILANPGIVTRYAMKDQDGSVIANAEAFYRIISKRNNFIGKPVIDHWKVVAVKGISASTWEIATAFIATKPEYAMINSKIETIVYENHYEKK